MANLLIPLCVLCSPGPPEVYGTSLTIAIIDAHSVSVGHALVVTRRHVASYFDTTPEERAELWEAVEVVKGLLDASHKPDGYNIGMNIGEAAGQTVEHAHIHIIPRYKGNHPDPRGGIRNVLPAKANYLRSQPLTTGGSDHFLRHLVPLLAKADHASVVAAFVQESGLDTIEEYARAFLDRGGHFRLLTGDYLAITQAEALRSLLEWTAVYNEDRGRLEVRVVEREHLKATGGAQHGDGVCGVEQPVQVGAAARGRGEPEGRPEAGPARL